MVMVPEVPVVCVPPAEGSCDDGLGVGVDVTSDEKLVAEVDGERLVDGNDGVGDIRIVAGSGDAGRAELEELAAGERLGEGDLAVGSGGGLDLVAAAVEGEDVASGNRNAGGLREVERELIVGAGERGVVEVGEGLTAGGSVDDDVVGVGGNSAGSTSVRAVVVDEDGGISLTLSSATDGTNLELRVGDGERLDAGALRGAGDDVDIRGATDGHDGVGGNSGVGGLVKVLVGRVVRAAV